MGWEYDEIGRYDEAIEAFKQAIDIKPDYVNAHHNLGIAYGKLGRHDEAIKAFKRAIHLKPDDTDTHYNLGLAYLLVGDRDLALEEYEILKALDKDLANELFNKIYE